MGKKGSWFSAIKRVFSPSSKERVVDGTGNKDLKDKKKKGVGKLKHGDGHSFIPLFREPSSIEKILGEVEREHHIANYKPLTPLEEPRTLPYATPTPPHPHPHPPVRTATLYTDASPRASSSRRTYSTPRLTSPLPQLVPSPPRVAIPTRVPSLRFVQRHRPEPTLKYRHICATKIQAAFRGYTARRSYRTLRGLVRLQGVMKGQSVKRQTENALKSMQLMVHVQNQIHSRRIQMLENQPLRNNNKDGERERESGFGNWNSSENTDEWEYSRLTKEEIEARMQRKVDALSKRERAMAYAYSHQLWKTSPKSAQAALADIRSGGHPNWWNWLENSHAPPPPTTLVNPSLSPAIKTPHFTPTPTRPNLRFKASPTPSPIPSSSHLGQLSHRFDNMDTSTPRSTKSAVPSRPNLARTPPGRLQQKLIRNNSPFKDDDSLMSCPPFSVPRYMSPTMSAKAKARTGKERVPVPDSPSSTVNESKRRVTFPFGQAFGSFKWKNKESGSKLQTLGDHLSVDSTISMPVNVGRRKPFNRYV